MEHDEPEERMEDDVAEMEERAEKLGEHIDEARSDWESKEADPSVPGARPDAEKDEEEDAAGGGGVVTETPGKESDQLPEEAPAEQVPDDDDSGARPEAEDSPGVPGEEGTATGNPDAAGSDE